MHVDPVRVFIVDDSPQLAEYLSELLRDPGRVEIVGSADSAAQAIERICQSSPDIVIVDLQLKVGNGFDVVKAIRVHPGNKHTVTILFTNHASRELQLHAMKLGADYSLDKYRDHAKVLEIVQEKVRLRQST